MLNIIIAKMVIVAYFIQVMVEWSYGDWLSATSYWPISAVLLSNVSNHYWLLRTSMEESIALVGRP